MTDDDWNKGYARSLAMRLAGDAIEEKDEKGRHIVDDTLLILLNAHHERLSFTLPAHKQGVRWESILDTSEPATRRKKVRVLRGGERYDVEARSLALLVLRESFQARVGPET